MSLALYKNNLVLNTNNNVLTRPLLILEIVDGGSATLSGGTFSIDGGSATESGSEYSIDGGSA